MPGGVEADITKCFDTIDHDGIVRMGAERIEDGRPPAVDAEGAEGRRARHRWHGTQPGDRTPQGGTVSPVLAKVFLHDVLDVWCGAVKRPGRGRGLSRYADDCVGAFAHQTDAERFDTVRGQR